MVTMHCSRPFTTLHVLHGCCATCCPHWLDPSAVVFGSRDDPWGVWNSEPFRALRRGGRWEDLLAALRFVANLRARGVLAEFQANFAIQAANVQEVPAFVRLAKDHRTTCIKFALLGRTWHSEAQIEAYGVR
jgi:hypothetical protein